MSVWHPIINYRGLPPIKVRNTFGNRLEVFEPFTPGIVKMYVCGPTVYDYTHIGHARTYVAFDAIKRYLKLRGYDVIHVQNITDIDDKIINRAQSEGRDWREIVEEYSKDYFENIKKLKVYVDISPRVTSHISDIIEFIKGLIEKGYAYVASSGSVYFEVDKYPDYGKLSGRFHPEQWRQEEDVVREKKKPYDFALWKAWKPGEPYWESPWGKGRPGWHIECSVMSSKYLGKQIDIHGGGQDLIFPHHENERAQSEAYFGVKPWVKYWLHTGMLTVRGEKMSKSLGNIITLKDAIRKWGADTLRLWILSAHYRTQLEYNEESLTQMRALLNRLKSSYRSLERIVVEGNPQPSINGKQAELISRVYNLYMEFHGAMSNDFNTAKALAAVSKLVRLANSEIIPSENYTAARLALKLLLEFNSVFAVLDDVVYGGTTEYSMLVNRLVDLIVKVRGELRSRKMYDLADMIRSELSTLGIKLYDYPGGKTIWRLEE